MHKNIRKATLGGGCFWCIEAVFEEIKGVISVVSGYAGGKIKKPTYEQVCSSDTGHIEVVQLTFNDGIVDYETLLRIFFRIHDPTSIDKQGNDTGRQYRSVIFYHNLNQKKQAESIINELNNNDYYDDKIVTKLRKYKNFYKAEDYHQDYYTKNKNDLYCQLNIVPKIKKVNTKFKKYLKSF